MARTQTETVRRLATAFIFGAAGTAISGVLEQLVVRPATTVSDQKWSYPWTADTFVAATLRFAVFGALIVIGLTGLRSSGAAGASATARRGADLAIAGNGLLVIGQIASLPIRRLWPKLAASTGPHIGRSISLHQKASCWSCSRPSVSARRRCCTAGSASTASSCWPSPSPSPCTRAHARRRLRSRGCRDPGRRATVGTRMSKSVRRGDSGEDNPFRTCGSVGNG